MKNIIRLNNGVEMPMIGFGTYQMPPSITERCVSDALTVGYRHIDTAQCYGNEREVGLAVKKSGIRREDIFVTTKLWGFRHPTLSHIAEAHGKTAAQIALRFLYQKGIPVIPKSTHIERMKENLDFLDFELSSDEMETIKSMDKGKSLFAWW